MNSAKVLLKTYTEHPEGYGQMFAPSSSSSECWEKMQEIIPKNGKYLNHFVESTWVKNDKYSINDESNKEGMFGQPFAVGIPKGDLSYWLIVYWE